MAPSNHSWLARSTAASIALILSACLALLAPSPAAADHGEITVFDPPGVTLMGKPAAQQDVALDRIASLGANAVRVIVPWRSFAPDPNQSRAPVGFDPTNPDDYPQAPLGQLDTLVREISSRGMQPILTPGGPTPNWASRSGRSSVRWPKPGDFGKFVEALGTRYSGPCLGPGCSAGGPPAVSFWAIWNEPNLALFLQPQKRGRYHIAAYIYRRLFLAAQAGLAASGHASDQILIGETSPSRGKPGTAPERFLLQTLCIDPNSLRTNRSCEPISATGWSEHPYLPNDAPWQKPPAPYISISTLGRLSRLLGLAYADGETTQQLPLYITEYGVESFPRPAKRFGVSPQRQAEYLGISEYLSYKNPWVRSYAQYLITDDQHAGSWLSFQTGLRYANDAPKPSWAAFPMTLVAQRTGAFQVTLWGHVRPGTGPRVVTLTYQDPNGDSAVVGEVTTDAEGYFQTTADYQPDREFQASTTLLDGSSLKGPLIRAYWF